MEAAGLIEKVCVHLRLFHELNSSNVLIYANIGRNTHHFQI
jgi:hypothetical protein